MAPAHFVIYWPRVYEYFAAGAVELVRLGHRVTVVVLETSELDEHFTRRGLEICQTEDWITRARAESPDVELYCGWHFSGLTQFLRIRRAVHPIRLLYFDTQWDGTLRQLVRLPAARAKLRRLFHGCFVPGTMQASFAARLGFDRTRVLIGALTHDASVYSKVPPLSENNLENRRAFLFVGRLVRAKGVDLLYDAYATYRSSTKDPWDLLIAGAGQLSCTDPGITQFGHLSHEALAAAMRAATTLVLPSRFEPFGAVVQEASAAGLHLITSEWVGASPDRLRPGVNGIYFNPYTSGAIAAAMEDYSTVSNDWLIHGGRVSRSIAATFGPEPWARALESATKWEVDNL